MNLPACFLVLCTVIATVSGQSPQLGNYRSRLPTGQGPAVECLMVDVNGDGMKDLIRATTLSFGVWLQDRAGRFNRLSVTRPSVSTLSHIVSLAVGHVTQAKLPDLLVGHRNGQVALYANVSGKYAKGAWLPKVTGSTSPALAKVLVGNVDATASDEVILLLNQERPVVYGRSLLGFSQLRRVGPAIRTPRAALGDLDGDGDLDLVVATGGSAAVPGIYINKVVSRVRGLYYDASVMKTAVSVSTVVIANVLNNKLPEIILGPNSALATGVAVYRNTSSTSDSPSLASVVTLASFAVIAPRDMQAADFDGDGRQDLAVIQANGSLVLGLNNNPKLPGAFSKAVTLLAAAPRAHLCAMDLESDGDIDIVTAGAGVEDSLLLGAKGVLPNLDTEAQGMPIGSLHPSLVGVADVTGEGDPDIAIWSSTGVPRMLRNDQGQARFRATDKSQLPTLPASVYNEIQPAAITSNLRKEFLIAGPVSIRNPTGVRVIAYSLGILVDATGARWKGGSLNSITAADLSGGAAKSLGTHGLSDVVGIDRSGYITVVFNKKGTFGSPKIISTSKAKAGSKFLVADFNLDGKNDIAIVQPGLTSLRILLAHKTTLDTFVEQKAITLPAPAVTGIVGEGTGDKVPDLLISTSKSKLVLLAGRLVSFQDVSSKQLGKVATLPAPATSLALIGSTFVKDRSIVVGFEAHPDRILHSFGGFYIGPTSLPVRGSVKTRALLVRDLDLDGDDDLVIVRADSLPALQIGQTTQYTNVGVSQVGREALLRISYPPGTRRGAICLGYQVIRADLGGLGILRLPGAPVVLVMAPGELRVPLAPTIGAGSVPLQLWTLTTTLGFRNLDVFRIVNR